MLVLKLRTGSSIRIGPDVNVTVETVDGGDVCLAVECPLSTDVRDLVESEMPWDSRTSRCHSAARRDPARRSFLVDRGLDGPPTGGMFHQSQTGELDAGPSPIASSHSWSVSPTAFAAVAIIASMSEAAEGPST